MPGRIQLRPNSGQNRESGGSLSVHLQPWLAFPFAGVRLEGGMTIYVRLVTSEPDQARISGHALPHAEARPVVRSRADVRLKTTKTKNNAIPGQFLTVELGNYRSPCDRVLRVICHRGLFSGGAIFAILRRRIWRSTRHGVACWRSAFGLFVRPQANDQMAGPALATAQTAGPAKSAVRTHLHQLAASTQETTPSGTRPMERPRVHFSLDGRPRPCSAHRVWN